VRTKPKDVKIITLGCAKNLYDSEVIAGALAPFYRVRHEQGPDRGIVIINTCGFIGDAKEESIDTILHYGRLRQEGKIDRLIVTGCLSQRYKDVLAREIPEADAWFGNSNLEEVVRHLVRDYRNELVGERLLGTPSHYAYLKISEGCDRSCAFCAIPRIRGRHRSRPVEELAAEARRLANRGVKELILIAQDLTFYGLDLYGKRDLPRLLRELSRIEGIEWIRLHYMYPAGFPEEVLEVMRDEPKIVNYIDIPLQHIDDGILRSMRRGAGEKETRRLLKRIRSTIPDAHIRTVFITGYPGESEEAFRKLYRFVEEQKFDRMGVFTYSREEGTPAWPLGDPVPREVKLSRKQALLDLQEKISRDKNRRKIGRTMRVLIDAPEEGGYLARTEFDSPEVDNEVHVLTDRRLEPGTFAEVRITDADAFDLWAELAR